MSRPSVSIIVPIYNGEQTLIPCIESARSQTNIDWEMILINDGSTDSTEDICRRYCEIDTRIRMLSQENAGVSASRNAGMEIARGRYLTFLDADDTLAAPDSILYMYAFIEEHQSEIASFALKHEALKASSKQLPFGDVLGFLTHDQFTETLTRKINFPWTVGYGQRGPCARLYKTSFIRNERITFDVHQVIAEDYVFVLKCLIRASSVTFDEKSVYIVNHCGESATRGYIQGYFNKTWPASREAIEILRPYFSTKAYQTALQYIPLVLRLNEITEEGKPWRRKGMPHESFLQRYRKIKHLCSSDEIRVLDERPDFKTFTIKINRLLARLACWRQPLAITSLLTLYHLYIKHLHH